MNLIRRLIQEEEGQTYVEYAILVAVLAIAVGATSLFIKDGITTYFNNINNVLSGATVEPLT